MHSGNRTIRDQFANKFTRSPFGGKVDKRGRARFVTENFA